MPNLTRDTANELLALVLDGLDTDKRLISAEKSGLGIQLQALQASQSKPDAKPADQGRIKQLEDQIKELNKQLTVLDRISSDFSALHKGIKEESGELTRKELMNIKRLLETYELLCPVGSSSWCISQLKSYIVTQPLKVMARLSFYSEAEPLIYSLMDNAIAKNIEGRLIAGENEELTRILQILVKYFGNALTQQHIAEISARFLIDEPAEQYQFLRQPVGNERWADESRVDWMKRCRKYLLLLCIELKARGILPIKNSIDRMLMDWVLMARCNWQECQRKLVKLYQKEAVNQPWQDKYADPKHPISPDELAELKRDQSPQPEPLTRSRIFLAIISSSLSAGEIVAHLGNTQHIKWFDNLFFNKQFHLTKLDEKTIPESVFKRILSHLTNAECQEALWQAGDPGAEAGLKVALLEGLAGRTVFNIPRPEHIWAHYRTAMARHTLGTPSRGGQKSQGGEDKKAHSRSLSVAVPGVTTPVKERGKSSWRRFSAGLFSRTSDSPASAPVLPLATSPPPKSAQSPVSAPVAVSPTPVASPTGESLSPSVSQLPLPHS